MDTPRLEDFSHGGMVHMPKTRPPYPKEFRVRAVELMRSSGKSAEALATELGVSDQTLRNWSRQAEVDAGRGRPGDLTTGSCA